MQTIPCKEILETQYYFFRNMAVSCFEKDGLLAVSLGIDHPSYNFVLHTDLHEEALQALIPQISAFFDQQDVPWTWQVAPFSCTNKLKKHLMVQGLKEIERFVEMGRSLTIPLPALKPFPGVIREVQNHADFKHWALPLQEGFISTAESTEEFHALTKRIPYGEKEAFHHYVLYVDERPVASTTLSVCKAGGRLDNVAVSPLYQHKGFGTAIALHTLHEAKRLGADQCFLDSSMTGVPLYKKLGFEAYCTCQMYG